MKFNLYSFYNFRKDQKFSDVTESKTFEKKRKQHIQKSQNFSEKFLSCPAQITQKPVKMFYSSTFSCMKFYKMSRRNQNGNCWKVLFFVAEMDEN